MKRLGLPLHKIKAIFISHEHSDHTAGLKIFSNKYRLPVYITAATRQHCRLKIDAGLLNIFTAGSPVVIGKLSITAFPKKHDACDPHSFIINDENITVGVFTDIGTACEQVTKYFKLCNAAFLEANYDEDMLAAGRYTYHLKRRISGGNGHLSNRQALELFLKCKTTALKYLILSHLSKENNCPDLVHSLFSLHAGTTEIAVASRYTETPLYCIFPNNTEAANNLIFQEPVQLSLF